LVFLNSIDFIDRTVAHEYFRNWTGNRVTCRDWFQLSLKKGLTVLREQQYAGDRYSKPVVRIQTVHQLRSSQFPEYALMVEQIRALDPLNPQVTARMARNFERWKRFELKRQALMKAALEQVAAVQGLSKEATEVVTKALA
jgi:aminopeptidase N